MITSDSVMLNVKNASSSNGGSGTTTIASNATTSSGTPSPKRPTSARRAITAALMPHLWLAARGRGAAR